MLTRKYHFCSSVCCEQGDVREYNQDCTLALSGEVGGYAAGLYMVADGCGGLAHGEKISRLLADSFTVIWREALPSLLAMPKLTSEDILRALSNWLRQINAVAYAFGRQTESKVGSTLTLLLLLNDAYYILNVGDSRAYLCRNGNLQRLTEDQSLLADMLHNREITPEEARRSERRNVLTMCIGYFEQLQSFCASGKIKRDDIFLLCSDGFYGALSAEKLRSHLPAAVAENSAADLRGLIPLGRAHDNVSVLLVQAL